MAWQLASQQVAELRCWIIVTGRGVQLSSTSVIIPALNEERFLDETQRSLDQAIQVLRAGDRCRATRSSHGGRAGLTGSPQCSPTSFPFPGLLLSLPICLSLVRAQLRSGIAV